MNFWGRHFVPIKLITFVGNWLVRVSTLTLIELLSLSGKQPELQTWLGRDYIRVRRASKQKVQSQILSASTCNLICCCYFIWEKCVYLMHILHWTNHSRHQEKLLRAQIMLLRSKSKTVNLKAEETGARLQTNHCIVHHIWRCTEYKRRKSDSHEILEQKLIGSINPP